MDTSANIAAELELRLVDAEHGGVPLTAGLCYRGDDPYAIRMIFHVGTSNPVEWIFARDLLTVGLSQMAGDGDVRVWPGPIHRDVLNIELSSPGGHAHFEAPLMAITGFLLRTFEVVPAGREEEFCDVDTELNGLLRRS
jgi:Streptomyces sporulation and cell division protein, SsgA